MDLRNVTNESKSLRDVAAATGYIAVFDHARKTVTLTETASYTFRLPSRLFNDALASKYKMTNNPGSKGGGGSSGSTDSSADATVDGGSVKAGSKVLLEYVKSLAGDKAEIQMLPDAGIITVRTKARSCVVFLLVD